MKEGRDFMNLFIGIHLVVVTGVQKDLEVFKEVVGLIVEIELFGLVNLDV